MKPYKAPVNFALIYTVLAALAFWALVIGSLFWTPGHAQTQLRADQILGGLPAPVQSAEAQWCPGPALVLENERTLVIGPNWSDARPCYAHFNLSPPAGVDPVNVSSFRAPVRIVLSPSAGSSLADELYIHLSAPSWTGGTMTRPQRVFVTATQPGAISCSGCVVETASAGQRMFPAFAMPVGMAVVQGGRFHPVLDSIIDTKQLYIGANLGIAVRRDGPGLWIELSSVQAQAAQAALQLEAARSSATAAMLEVTPPSRRMVTTVSSQLADVRQELDEIRSALPPTDWMIDQRDQYRMIRDQAEMLENTLRTLEQELMNMQNKMEGLREKQ